MCLEASLVRNPEETPTSVALDARSIRAHLLSVLPASRDEAIPEGAIDHGGFSKGAVLDAAKGLRADGLVGQVGAGVKGDPFRWWRFDSSEAQPRAPDE